MAVDWLSDLLAITEANRSMSLTMRTVSSTRCWQSLRLLGGPRGSG